YEKRVVLYLDILGFRALMNERKEDVLLSALEIPVDLQVSYPFNGQTNMQISAFSDTVVVSEIVGDGFGVVRLLNYSSYLWWKFLVRGVLTRGGLAVGDLVHNKRILLGPAMIEAYDLESQVAIYPRIVVSNGARDLFISGLTNAHKAALPMIQMGLRALRKDFDGIFHVNTIGSVSPTPPEIYGRPTLEPGESRSMSEKEIIQAKIDCVNHILDGQSTHPPKVSAKYDWLDRYCREQA
ncbi:MAG: hypothetical protein ACWA6R_10995, partial [Nitrosomonas sp.]